MDIIKNTDSNSELLTKIVEDWGQKQNPSFDELTSSVLQTHQTAQAGAIRAVNQMATLRNWLIGCYIVEYEQKGRDRAKYGDRLLKRLEESVNTKGLNVTLFQISRVFYNYYPQIGDIIYAMVSHKLPQEQIYATPSHKFVTPGKDLLGKLSFSHIREIMTQQDPLARFFYETECIKGTWSVKELRRQIATNLYFRSGVSKDPKKLLATIKPETNTPALTIRQPYSFKIKVSAPNQKAYDKTMQMVSYVAEGARQDAYIENLGEVDDSEVTSESLLAKEYTPFIHKKENLKDWLENRLDEDMKDLGFTRQTTPTQKKKSEDTPVTGTITFLKGLSIGSGTLRIYHGSNDTTIAFEFLGLKAKDVITESDLEDALISHLQEFLLELGKGFCFEDRQKRIIIDDEYYYPDLVFYHRILHCSVIVELKNDEFRHEYLGQLNAYVSYYKENEMHDGDNPPVGILLCTRKGKKMVEYALAGMDNQLFVSTYMLQLPDKSTLEKFLLDEIGENNP